MLRACRAIEDADVPTTAIVTSGFLGQADVVARAIGIPHVSISEYPGVIAHDSDAKLRESVESVLLPNVVKNLKGEGAWVATSAESDPSPTDIAFTGDFDQVQEYFHVQGWSDGLPVVPPTRDRVDAFLSFVDREPSEVLGTPLPALRKASVSSVAINGVMAGCRPEYMPILVAVVEAICDPEFRIEDAGSTPGWEPLIVLSGPIIEHLDFNTSVAAMRSGPQANTSIGRFLRLYLRNVVGYRTPPDGSDKGSIGQNFYVVMAENQAHTAAAGWPTLREDLGYSVDDNVVMVQSVVATSLPIYSGGESPVDEMEYITYLLQSALGPWAYMGIKFGHQHPLLLLGPSVALAFSQAGWTKDDIRQHLFEHVKLEARRLERAGIGLEGATVSLKGFVDSGLADPVYSQSDDPDRLVPLLLRPEWTNVVIAGDPGRNQSKAYINNHEQGVPVARKVIPPEKYLHLFASGQETE